MVPNFTDLVRWPKHRGEKTAKRKLVLVRCPKCFSKLETFLGEHMVTGDPCKARLGNECKEIKDLMPSHWGLGSADSQK